MLIDSSTISPPPFEGAESNQVLPLQNHFAPSNGASGFVQAIYKHLISLG